jgi:hypothetical protein
VAVFLFVSCALVYEARETDYAEYFGKIT